MKALSVSFTVVAIFFSLQCTALGMSEDLKRGIDLYNQKRFSLAKHYLAAATVSDPSSAMAHYYLANAFVYLRNHNVAQKHFTICSMLDPNGIFGTYAREALRAYAAPKSRTPASSKIGAAISGRLTQASFSKSQLAHKRSTASKSIQVSASKIVAEALENFKASRYYAAADLFEEAEALNPGDQQIHIYLGRTFEMLKELDNAKAEYTAAFRLGPFTDKGILAKEELVRLSASTEAKAHAPVDDLALVAKTIATIQSQSAEAQRRSQAEAAVIAHHRINLGNIEAQKINQQAGWFAYEALRDRFNPGDTEEISNWARIQTMYQSSDAQVQANKALIATAKYQADTQESANNLIRLLGARKVLPDDAVLRAFGTNLYVRYYGAPEVDDIAPSDPPVELKATALKLSDANWVLRPALKVSQNRGYY